MTNEPNEPQGTPRTLVYLDSSGALVRVYGSRDDFAPRQYSQTAAGYEAALQFARQMAVKYGGELQEDGRGELDMNERDRLVETLAQTIVPRLWHSGTHADREFLRGNTRQELAAIEAAGWVLTRADSDAPTIAVPTLNSLNSPRDRSNDKFEESAFGVVSVNIREIAHALNKQFAWAKTAEGHAYWADVSARLFSMAQNITNLGQRQP